MAKKAKAKDKDTIAVNRRARFDYDVTDTVEVGLVLTGTEVKSLRAGKASIAEAFATIRHGELWLVQANIPEYEFGNRQNHDPTRQRKLLAHRDEIAELARFTQEQGRTLIPLRLYWRDGKVKLLLGLAQGKALHDKRATIAERDAQRQIDRALHTRQRS
ncbi:MAG: SsrA-binding protein SmpB [Egibacteraceae bacterium]